MEAHKERMEQEKMKAGQQREAKKKLNECTAAKATATAARELIRESIISDGKGDHRAAAENPEDVLVFTRTVNKIDSSLE
ncbi:hypothetical protein OWV82_019040 [Melia azedarach]|uniref:Uncharacterized protein n=1 Tax=Melia azedarach TaxID=155640 RepID=A0ACC1XEL9_MELAZ|nr:hypothetical protein OWV82_019040 [Melia azedarach]